ncbi:MAG: hypothetical protein A2086_11285 [Spirochaetes bacterium GWD1_27_9]|nr:MAG: hypothetical protein A2Z98_16130 [Spirochaetes bacterium GWB1_27_13]OHD24975.1 MAG: hypothetical protein A2Y34_10165 [Spirochaetes bacterium GWC1_27_15]OHD44157.1 MAG: hypothetical protein A2086_11285 [Spirochaetes bacterium GWD1_27_9]
MKLLRKIDIFTAKRLSKIKDNLFITLFSRIGNFFFSFLIIALFFFIPLPQHKEIAIISFFSLCLNTGIVFILKHTVRRKRFLKEGFFLSKVDPFSFPSGHSGRLGGFVIPTISIPIISIIFLILSIIVSFSRMVRGYHYFNDCFFGFLIGLLSGFMALQFSDFYIPLLRTVSHIFQ